MFLALFTASCKVRGRSGWSNWYGQVLQWQGGGQVGERNPAPRVDERNRDVSTTIVRPFFIGPRPLVSLLLSWETMLRLSRLKTAVVVTLEGALFGVALFLAGCSGGSEEEGRIRVTPAQVIGVYELKLDKGTERLELKADGTYAQDTVSQTRPVHRTGQWRIENHFFDGGEVVLIGVAIESLATPLDENPQLRFGDLSMYAHERSGKVALARNEVADWYYERTH